MGKNTNIALNNIIIVLPYNDNSDSFLDDALSVFLLKQKQKHLLKKAKINSQSGRPDWTYQNVEIKCQMLV